MGTPTERRKPRELSLFTGIGGGVLGSELLGWKPVCYVEHDGFCQRVLQQRIADGWIADAPIWDDVRTFNGLEWRGRVDVLTAGFPCQPTSTAGDQKASDHKRWLWPEVVRIAREVRPEYVWLENPTGLLAKSHGKFGDVLTGLASLGMSAVWSTVPASSIGAPHHRERLWVLGYTNENGESDRTVNGQEASRMPEVCGDVRRWPDSPDGLGMDDGLPDRVDRLKSLGNAQVPQQMALAWTLLSRRVRRLLR